MQAALLAGLPTTDLRTKLAAANEVADVLIEEMSELREQSREVWVKVNSIQADIIRANDAARLAALVTPADVAEFAVVGADLSALQQMLDNAQSEVATLDTKPAQDKLRLAEKAHHRDQNEIAFAAVAEQVTKLETALCDAVATLHGIGQQLGKVSLVMSWKPSQRLDRAVKNGVIP